MTLGSLLAEQLPPGKVGHAEVTHVEDADDDTHGPHGQARVNVPEKQQMQFSVSRLYNVQCPPHLLYSLSVSVEELVTLARVSPCQVMMATTPLAMNMKVPIKFQIG